MTELEKIKKYFLDGIYDVKDENMAYENITKLIDIIEKQQEQIEHLRMRLDAVQYPDE